MRRQFCAALLERAANPNLVFLTGDLGFMALEPLQEALADRFINAGVAEQNMISVAAALAKDGFEVWAYSIAPFCFARAFEQIRNDICLHHLPVTVVGNGGGYAYGVMGPTHHATEDYGVLLTLDGMRVTVPAFDEDVRSAAAALAQSGSPGYLRLGLGMLPAGEQAPPFAAWRRLLPGRGPPAIAVGPLAGAAMTALVELPECDRPELWVAACFPLELHPPPVALMEKIKRHSRFAVVEEHIKHGGAGSMLCHWLLMNGVTLSGIEHLHVKAHPPGRYGSQNFLRRQSGLHVESIRHRLVAWSSLETASPAKVG
jgi:transketolase